MTARELLVAHDPARVAAWCHERLRPGTIYVAPSAAARGAARRAALGKLGVAVGARIVNASGLLDAVESRAGLPPLRMVGGALSRLLLVDAGRAARIPLFDAATPAGAVAALARLVRNLRLNDVSPEAYEAGGGDARAAAAYVRYESARARLGLADEAGRLQRVTAAMPALGSVVLEDAAVTSTLHARFFAAFVARAEAVHVGIPSLSDAAPPAACGPAAAARAFFRELGLTETTETAADARPSMESLAGVGPDGEVALVARHIRRLLADGTPAESVLGVAPGAIYLERLHAACARIGVPVASPRRIEVLDVPLVRTLLAVVGALADAEQDTAESGVALLGTPYLGLGLRVHDAVHRRLTLAGMGSLRSWRAHARLPERHATAKLAGAIEEMATSLAKPQTPAALATTASRLVLDFGFLAAARRHYLAAGRDEAVRADQQAWEVVQEAFDEVGEAFAAMGRKTVAAGEWLAELTLALQGESVRLDHRGVRGVHLTIAGAGLLAADHVFAVGWREGVFPRRPREDALLPDAVKVRLNAAGARFALGADRAAHEEERRDRIIRAARQRLTVTWPQVASDGTPQLRSFFAQDVGVPVLRAEHAASVGETTWPLDLAADRGEQMARVAVLLRHKRESRIGAERPALDVLLRGLGDEEAQSLRGERHAPQRIAVPDDLVEGMRRAAAHQSAGQANMLAQCLYQHFGTRRLEVASLAAPQVDPKEIGTIAHRALADVALEGGFDPERAGVAFDRRWEEGVPPHLAADAKVLFDGRVLRGQVVRLAEGERDLLAGVQARPTLIEFGFGMPTFDDERRDPASIRDGVPFPLADGAAIASVILRGAIDRVDVLEVDGKRYGVAIDYKTGKAERYGKKLEELADFQLPVYCAVLRHVGVEPVGAVFLGVADGERHGWIRKDFAHLFVRESDKGVKRLDPADFDERLSDALAELATLFARAALPEVVVSPRDDDCGWCELAPLCRIGTFAVGGHRGEDG